LANSWDSTTGGSLSAGQLNPLRASTIRELAEPLQIRRNANQSRQRLPVPGVRNTPPVRFGFTLGLSGHAAFFLCAHLAFIIADNFFRMAGLIGFRVVAFFEAGVTFLDPSLPFCSAHQAFFAAPILARAAALMR